jgi:alcohol dehydrogenase (cytochrome c)
VTCPVVQGANNWEGLSFDPDSGYAFIPTTEWCMSIGGTEAPTYVAGQHYTGAKISAMKPDNMDTTGALQAIDVATGEVVWRVDQPLGVRSPTMVTKGGVLFVGDVGTREFRAIEAATGKELWSFKTNSGVVGVPTTFEVDSVQYVAVEAGAGGNAVSDVKNAATALNVPYTEIQGGVIWVFALPQQPAAH